MAQALNFNLEQTTWVLTKTERKYVSTIASVYLLRVLGALMLLPVFTLYVPKTWQAEGYLIGLALGSYGLTQAILQIPCGILSDRFGRKPIILFGLIMLLAGSVCAALAENIFLVIIGRLLQGSGAIGSVLLATVADNTREQIRPKAMGLVGMAVALAFISAIVLGPVIAEQIGIKGIFWTAAIFALVSILLVKILIKETKLTTEQPVKLTLKQIIAQIINVKLINFYLSALIGHIIFAALFIILPLMLKNSGFTVDKLWQVYLGSLASSFMLAMYCLKFKKNTDWQKISIFILFFALLVLVYANICTKLMAVIMVIGMIVFFLGFNLLEASLPSQIARTVAVTSRGAALAVYSSAQFLGVFLGSTLGGCLQTFFGNNSIITWCLCLIIAWWLVTLYLKTKV